MPLALALPFLLSANGIPGGVAQARIELPLQFLAIANNDGSESYAKSTAVCRGFVERLNRAYAPANIVFTWNPDDYRLIRNDVFNTNFDRNRDAIAERSKNGQLRQQGWAEHDKARTRVRNLYPDKVCCFFVRGSEWKSDPSTGRFIYAPSDTSWGGRLTEALLVKDGAAITHEIGHFLGLVHSYKTGNFETFEKFSAAVKSYVNAGHPIEEGLDAFENDREAGVRDTPPDPGSAFWSRLRGESIPATVIFDDGRSYTYSVQRERTNFMGGSADAGLERISPDQAKIARIAALEKLKMISAIKPAMLQALVQKRAVASHEMGPNLLASSIWKAMGDGSLENTSSGWILSNEAGKGTVKVSTSVAKLDRTEYELSYEARSDRASTVEARVVFENRTDMRISNTGGEWVRITRTFAVGATTFDQVEFQIGAGVVSLRNIELRRVNSSL